MAGGGSSESTVEPWVGYQPSLIGQGPMPSWLQNGRPGPAQQDWANMNSARGAGASLQMMGMDPSAFAGGMGVAPSQFDNLLYGSWNLGQPDMYAGAGTMGIGGAGGAGAPGGGGDGGTPPVLPNAPPAGDFYSPAGVFYSPGIGSLLAGGLEGLDWMQQPGGPGNGLVQMSDGSWFSPGGPSNNPIFGSMFTSQPGNWGNGGLGGSA
jgi:hypothetical protein